MDFDFPVEVDSIDTIPEAARGLYQEKDGKFTLPETLKKKLDTSALSQAYQREKADAKKLKEQIRAFESLGKTPEEMADIVKGLTEKANADAEKNGDWEKLKAQMLDSHSKEVNTLKDVTGKLQGKLEKYLIEAEAARQIAEHKGNATVLLPHVKSKTRVVEEDGEYQVRVLDDRGDPRVDGKGEYLTIKDLVAEMQASDVFGCAFTGTGASGSGSNSAGQQNNSGVPGAAIRSKMSDKEKAAYIEMHGLERFQALPN